MANDRSKRNLEVLRNAVDKDRAGGGAPGSGGGAPGSGGGGGGGQIMYRGKPVGRSGGGRGAPGAPSRGGNGPAPAQNQANDGGDVKEALRKLTQLFNDGLITTAEYDAKRAEILNRL